MRFSLSTLVARAVASRAGEGTRPEPEPKPASLPDDVAAEDGLERWAAEWEGLTRWLQDLDSALPPEARSQVPIPAPEPISKPSTWGLVVRPIARFSTIRTIQGLLEATPGIDRVRLERLEQGVACFQVTSGGATPAEAVTALAQMGARQSGSNGAQVEVEIGPTSRARSLTG